MHERLTHCPMGDEIDWITPNIGVCSHKIMCFTSEGLATDWPFSLSGFPYEIIEGLIEAVRAERDIKRALAKKWQECVDKQESQRKVEEIELDFEECAALLEVFVKDVITISDKGNCMGCFVAVTEGYPHRKDCPVNRARKIIRKAKIRI